MRTISICTALCLVGCAGTPTAPTTAPPPVVEACVRDRTAILTFDNNSPNRLSFDVYLDGSRAVVLAPGQRSADVTVAAGVAHRIEWRVTNTNLLACTAEPVPVACSRTNHICGF